MTNSDSDGLFDNDWEDRGELSWTEAEWVKYLNAQETAVHEYLKHYEQLTLVTDRIDEVARRMGWELAALTETALEESADESDEEFDDDWVPYTLHPAGLADRYSVSTCRYFRHRYFHRMSLAFVRR